MADIIGALKKVAPWIGAAASVALPGPLGAAAGALGKVLGSSDQPATVEATQQGIENAFQTIMGDPDKIAKLRQVDNDFKLAWQAAGFKQEIDIESLAVADRKDARAREIAVRDNTPKILAYLYAAGFFITLGAEIWIAISGVTINALASKSIDILLGVLTAMVLGTKEYYFGSSAGSARKSELLAQASAINGDAATEKAKE